MIISRRRSSSACTRKRTSGDRRTRTVEAENHKFPVFLPRGDASCYATITNDGDVVHHQQAHVRTYDCHSDAGETVNNFRTQPRAEIDGATGAAAVNETRAGLLCDVGVVLICSGIAITADAAVVSSGATDGWRENLRNVDCWSGRYVRGSSDGWSAGLVIRLGAFTRGSYLLCRLPSCHSSRANKLISSNTKLPYPTDFFPISSTLMESQRQS